jgi:hypothetical protein
MASNGKVIMNDDLEKRTEEAVVIHYRICLQEPMKYTKTVGTAHLQNEIRKRNPQDTKQEC